MSAGSGTDIVTTSGSDNLPSMYGGSSDVSLDDIIIPRIQLIQGSSNLAKSGDANEGDLVHLYGSDDPTPTFLVGGPDKLTSTTGYVLLRKKTAATTADGSIQFQAKRDMNDPDSWDVWLFWLAFPHIDPFLPARWMLWKTAGSPAARQINTMLQRQLITGADDPLPIKIEVKPRTNKRGQVYSIPVVSPATSDPDDLKVATAIRDRSASLLANMATENDGPEAATQPSFA